MLSVVYDWQGEAPQPAPLSLGQAPDGSEVIIDMTKLFAGRLLVLGPSGSGKSTLMRRLIHNCAPTQWLVFDMEGEYEQHIGHTYHVRPTTDPHASALKVRVNRSSVVVDLSDLKREAQLIFVSQFLTALVETPEMLWCNQCLVFLDECELLTPSDLSAFDNKDVGRRSRTALIDLMSRGRKRGLCCVLAVHRLAQLSKSVASEARNFLVGGCSLDVDIHRAAELLGWTRRRAFEILPHLRTGQFVCIGQAFSQSPTIVTIPKE